MEKLAKSMRGKSIFSSFRMYADAGKAKENLSMYAHLFLKREKWKDRRSKRCLRHRRMVNLSYTQQQWKHRDYRLFLFRILFIDGCIKRTPCDKSRCSASPVTDWFMGDDYHHNGAFMLCDGFRFVSSMNRPALFPQNSQHRLLLIIRQTNIPSF